VVATTTLAQSNQLTILSQTYRTYVRTRFDAKYQTHNALSIVSSLDPSRGERPCP
jgi:hypothetical protein